MDTGRLIQIASLVVSVISVSIAVLSCQANKYIAITSGVLERPTTTLGIGKVRLNKSEETMVIFGTETLSGNGVVAIGAVPFSYANEGKKTVDAPSLTFRFHKLFNREGLASGLTLNASGGFAAGEVKTSLTSDETFDYFSYQARALDPGVALIFHEPFYMADTQVKTDIPATTKDGKQVTMSVTFPYWLTFLVTTTGRDVAPVNYFVKISFTKTSSVQNLATLAFRDHIPNAVTDFRKQFGFWQYLFGLVFRTEERRIFLVFGKTRELRVADGKTLLVPDLEAEVARISYNLLSWSHLFQ